MNAIVNRNDIATYFPTIDENYINELWMTAYRWGLNIDQLTYCMDAVAVSGTYLEDAIFDMFYFKHWTINPKAQRELDKIEEAERRIAEAAHEEAIATYEYESYLIGKYEEQLWKAIDKAWKEGRNEHENVAFIGTDFIDADTAEVLVNQYEFEGFDESEYNYYINRLFIPKYMD